MSVTPLKVITLRSLHEDFEQHCEDNRKEFTTVNNAMAASQKTTHDQLEILIEAFGLSKHDDKKPPVGLMSSKEWFWKVAGAMGGLLVIEKIIVAIGPMTWSFLVSAAKIIAGIH